MPPAGFPNATPAYTMHVVANTPVRIGDVSESGDLSIITFAGGYMKNEPGVTPAVDADITWGGDLIRADRSGKHVRLDVQGLMKDKKGPHISFAYAGYIELTPAVLKVFSGAPDSASTEFGNSFTHFKFETGDEALKPLENGKYVGAGRFIVEHGKPLVVEYKISKLVL